MILTSVTGEVTCFACLSKLALFQNRLVAAGVCTDCTTKNPVPFIISTFFLFLHEDFFFISLTHLWCLSSKTHGCSHSTVSFLCNSYVMQSLNFCFQAYSLLLMSTQFKPVGMSWLGSALFNHLLLCNGFKFSLILCAVY